jgi:hypothetical protein
MNLPVSINVAACSGGVITFYWRCKLPFVHRQLGGSLYIYSGSTHVYARIHGIYYIKPGFEVGLLFIVLFKICMQTSV